MDKFDVKTLKKLADACRKAGIRSFEGYGYKFELADELPAKPQRKSKNAPTCDVQMPDELKSDTLTDEQLLYYSAGGSFGQDTSEGNPQ